MTSFTEGQRKHPAARCEECTLCSRPYVPDAIVPEATLAVIGEMPSEWDVRSNIPFAGPPGQLLAQCISKAGGVLSKVSRHNVVACRPPDQRPPTAWEVDCCLPRFLAGLESLPESIPLAVLGKTAGETFLKLSGKDPNMKVSERQGHWFQYGKRHWIATWHPAYVMYKSTEAPVLHADIRKAVAGPKLDERVLQEPRVIDIQTYEQLVAVLSTCPDGTRVAFDLETDNVNWYHKEGAAKDTILTMALAWKFDEGVAISADLLYDDPRAAPYIQAFLNRVKLGAHNGKFDVVFLATGIGLDASETFVFDTMLAHYALDETPGKQGLKYLATDEFGIPNYEELIIKQYLRNRNDSYSKIPYDKLILYAVWDVVVTLRLWEVYEQRLQAEGLYEWPFVQVLMPAQRELTKTELLGVKVDVNYLKAWTNRLQNEAAQAAEHFKTMVGKPNLNINSPTQLAALFYDELRLPDPGRVGARGRNSVKPRSTDRGALVKLHGMHPCLEVLSHYRRVTKMISSYALSILEYVSTEGRVHPSYKIHGTETGRLSAVDPAIQTIPRPDDRYGAILRSSFVADPGKTFIIVDYSQGELRAAAGLSGDPFLIKVYDEGRDLHSEVAVAMYGPHFTKAQRVICKMFNFSYLYGGTEHSFAESAGLPLKQAKEFVQEYNRVMPRLAKWKEEMVQSAINRGYIETVFGRRRRFKVFSRDTLEEIHKAAVNMPVQSVMSDFNLISGVRLSQQGLTNSILVHDSLIIQAPIHEAEAVAARAVKMLEDVGTEFLPKVKWVADAEITDRWCSTPGQYVAGFATPKKVTDEFALKGLVTWLKGEIEPIAWIEQAQALPITDIQGRIERLQRAAVTLEIE